MEEKSSETHDKRVQNCLSMSDENSLTRDHRDESLVVTIMVEYSLYHERCTETVIGAQPL